MTDGIIKVMCDKKLTTAIVVTQKELIDCCNERDFDYGYPCDECPYNFGICDAYVAKYGTAPYGEESREDRYTDEEIVIDM